MNRFHAEAETLEGHRFVEMHVLFRNGQRAGLCGREGRAVELSLICEASRMEKLAESV